MKKIEKTNVVIDGVRQKHIKLLLEFEKQKSIRIASLIPTTMKQPLHQKPFGYELKMKMVVIPSHRFYY